METSAPSPDDLPSPDGLPSLDELPGLDDVLAEAARRVVDGIDADGFIAWFAAEVPTLSPPFARSLGAGSGDRAQGDGAPGDRAPGERALKAFARALWNRFPQPDNRFRPRPLPEPARNAPCHCGSGRKHKQCCLPKAPAFGVVEGLPLLLHVLDAYPARALGELDVSAMDAEALLDTLDTWGEEGAGERVVRLAAPMFASRRRLPRHAPDVLELLLGHWPAGFRERAFESLADDLAGDADEALASVATVALARRRAANGDLKAAWALLRDGVRRFPDEPEIALLEVDLLLEEDRTEEAVATARRWRERLLAIDPDHAGFADDLVEHAAYVDPERALERACAADGVLERFVALVEETPPGPIAGTHAPIGRDRELVLTPTPLLAATEARWRERFGERPMPAVPDRADDAVDLEAIVAFLDEAPEALSSFLVLERLAAGPGGRAEDAVSDALLPRVLTRAEALLYRHVSREAGFETEDGLPDWSAMVWDTAPRLSWRHEPNRAALELLYALAAWHHEERDDPASFERAEVLAGALAGLDPEFPADLDAPDDAAAREPGPRPDPPGDGPRRAGPRRAADRAR